MRVLGSALDGMSSSGSEDWLAGVWKQRNSRLGQTLLKGLSLGTGAFLLIAGCVGLTAIFSLQFVYFIGSIYTMFFGALVLVVELRDKLPIISALYMFVDDYLKFLTTQRGKGLFCLGVGLLIIFIQPDGTSRWGLNNVAALFLAIVVFLHTFKLIHEPKPELGPGDEFVGEIPRSITDGPSHGGLGSWTDVVRANETASPKPAGLGP